MSVQVFKWIILFVVAGTWMSATCQVNHTEKSQSCLNTSITILNPTSNVLDSLVSILHGSTGDLTEEITHTTLDKKAFIKSFIYLLHSNIQSLENYRQSLTSGVCLLVRPAPIDYYIYTLQKIII